MAGINDEEEQDQVFRHFSHEHTLEFTNNVNEVGTVRCYGCNLNILPGRGYYTCNNCAFALHIVCFNLPRKIRHPADTHDLILVALPSFECKACGISGSGFSYNCGTCSHNYHSLCSLVPLSMSCTMHPHEMRLEFSPPYEGVKGFRCDVCRSPGGDHWLYRCGDCEFDAHVNCAMSNRRNNG